MNYTELAESWFNGNKKDVVKKLKSKKDVVCFLLNLFPNDSIYHADLHRLNALL